MKQISFSDSIKSSNVKEVTLGAVLNEIGSSNALREKVEAIRNISDSEERRALKQKTLPYFVIALFKDNKRRRENLLKSDMMIFDYDHIGDTIEEKKKKLKQDPRVYSVFISPSGDGLKVIYKLDKEITDPNVYSANYKEFAKEFQLELGAQPDKQTSDVSRACFMSYDPDIYINENAEPLEVDLNLGVREERTFNLAEHNHQDLEHLDNAIEFLRNHKLNYDEWVNCGFALASLGDRGRDYFIKLSINPHYDDTLNYINDKFDHILSSSSGVFSLASLFKVAIDHGFDYTTQNKTPIGEYSFADELREQFKLDDSRDPNKLIGHPLTKFKNIAKNLDGVQPGVYLIGAEANVGKTAFTTNLALDILDTNPDIQVVYFSLDDSRFTTIHRMLAVLTQLPINKIRKKVSNASEKILLSDKRNEILDLVESQRLLMFDLENVQSMKDVENILEDESFSNNNRVVFIDGLYNLEVEEKSDSIREKNIARANKIKLWADSKRLPIICTGELRKKMSGQGTKKPPTMHDIMETAKYSYNAVVVWMLYKTDDATNAVTLEWAKNKLSSFKDIQYLEFTPETGTMEEIAFSFMASSSNSDSSSESKSTSKVPLQGDEE